VEIRRDNSGQVISIILKRCLQVYDEKRQFKPIFDDKDLRELTCDTVLLAVGQSTDLSLLEEGGADIQQFRQGWPKVDPRTLASTGQGVFVAGDLAHGTKLIIDAVASGKLAARSVYTHITGRSLEANTMQAHIVLADFQREKGYEHIRRLEVPTAHADTRLKALHAQVELGYGEQQAIREASRCLDCGVTPVFDGTRCILCGGCVDVCPTLCLKIVSLDQLVQSDSLQTAIETSLGIDIEAAQNSAILKDEDRCIRCALCVKRCPADAIYMERVAFQSRWNQL
jgi:NAD-dependent dihydropyrimidine dehydrogenase PreA subunit